MNTSKNSILTYAIIILLVVNIIVIGMVMIPKYCSHRADRCCAANSKDLSQNKCLSKFLEKDLNFSSSQMNQFNELKTDFHTNTKVVFDSLDMLESDFFTELLKPQSDSNKLYAFANKFGHLQYVLKHQTIEHLIKIKKICSADQQQKYFDRIMKNRHCRAGIDMNSAQKQQCSDKGK